MKIRKRFFPGLLPLLVCSAAASVAQTTGSIEGTVTDATGAPLPGVTVVATSSSLQGTRSTQSRHDGSYRVPVVPPGDYRVRANFAGFRPSEKTANVRLDSTATVFFVLEPAAAEEIVVSGEAPL